MLSQSLDSCTKIKIRQTKQRNQQSHELPGLEINMKLQLHPKLLFAGIHKINATIQILGEDVRGRDEESTSIHEGIHSIGAYKVG